MISFPKHLIDAIEQRKKFGNLRTLKPHSDGIDFYSNDYLGLTKNQAFQDVLLQMVNDNPTCLLGSTGSRLISGNKNDYQEVESFIATQHLTESALLFPSGYKANLALFSCIATKHDTILVDELIHRSVHDGCRLSAAKKWKFKHNDLFHLEALLQKSEGTVFIAIESLYSMDGDFAPLQEITALAARYHANLIVDEAHAIGVFGYGLVTENQLQNNVFATVVTYGKAFGIQGAAILGTNLLKTYLINFASSFIYSTAMPAYQILSIQKAYQFIAQHPELKNDLHQKIKHFRASNLTTSSQDKSPIQTIYFSNVEKLHQTVKILEKEQLKTYAILAPTVKAGSERLRICLHQSNTIQEINLLTEIIQKYQNEN